MPVEPKAERVSESPSRVSTFVGRDPELFALGDALSEALAGRGQLVLVSGDAGMGKTRLADEAARLAAESGARVAWGRCWEAGGAPPYYVWLQVLRGLLDDLEPPARAEHIGRAGAHLARVLPEVGAIVTPPPPGPDPAADRFAVHDAIGLLIRSQARARRLMLVLDDLHAADDASLEVLHLLARNLRAVPLLLVATYRDAELRGRSSVARRIADIAREGQALRLTGLSLTGVAELIAQRVPHAPPALAEAVLAATAGSPLYVIELLRVLEQEGTLVDGEVGALDLGALEIPDGIRHTIRRRLERLDAAAQAVLPAASVLGVEFDLPVLAAICEMDELEAEKALEPAVRADLVVPSAAGGASFRFSHALVAQTTYGDVASSERRRLHLAAARAIEAVSGDRPDRVADLAHHYASAGPAGDPARALLHLLESGRRAMSQAAYDAAAQAFGKALEVSQWRASNEAARVEASIGVGQAEVGAGRLDEAEAAFQAAVSSSDASSELRAEAALGLVEVSRRRTRSGDHELAALEAALVALPSADTPIRVRIEAALSLHLADASRTRLRAGHDTPRRAQALAQDALASARRLGDPQLIVAAAQALSGASPEHSEHEFLLSDELVALAAESGSAYTRVKVHHTRATLFLRRGDGASFRREVDALSYLAHSARETYLTGPALEAQATEAFLRGDLRRCLELTDEVSGRLPYMRQARWMTTRFWVSFEQGRVDEQREPAGSQLIARAGAALHQAVTGRTQQAVAALPALLSDPFLELVEERPHPWTATLAALAELVVAVGARDAAARVELLLEPLAGRMAAYSTLFCLGPVDHYLGELALLRGDAGRAVERFASATAAAAALGATLWVAHGQRGEAAALVARAAQGDHSRASSLAAEAKATAERLELGRLLGLLAPVERALQEVAASSAFTARFARTRGGWDVAFEGRTFWLRDSKGLRYLAHLLAAPGREVPSLELARGRQARARQGGEALPDGYVPSGATSAPVLDERAKEAYRRRLEELRAGLDAADAAGDAERSQRLAQEMSFLVAELKSAVGLGGRDRPVGSDAERARQAVTKAIGWAIDRIAAENVALAQHLRASVRTGTRCCYAPAPDAARWDVRSHAP